MSYENKITALTTMDRYEFDALDAYLFFAPTKQFIDLLEIVKNLKPENKKKALTKTRYDCQNRDKERMVRGYYKCNMIDTVWSNLPN